MRRYFVENFKEPELLRLDMEDVEFRKLSLEDKNMLEDAFSKLEIKEVV